MDKNIEILLYNLEPEINKKCYEIQENKKEKILRKLFIITSILLLVIPSFLIILNINIWRLIIGVLCFISVSLIIMLPIVLIEDERGIYNE